MSNNWIIYKFDNFELNPSESSLLKSGNAVPITPKALSLLCLLTENQGHVLDKAYLLDQIWEDSFVEEGNLTFNIRQLRKILGDEVKNPKYIETVPKRGYRFIGNVEKIEPARFEPEVDKAVAPVFALPHGRESRKTLWKSWLLAIPVILAAGGFAAVESWFGIFDRSGPLPQLLVTDFSTERLSTDGNVRHVAISKSGKFMVYVSGSDIEKQSLRIRDLDSGQSREFIGWTDDVYGGIEVSHDDASVYFVRKGQTVDATPCLFRAKFTDGAPESLGCGLQGWFDISNDGKQISYVRCNYLEDDNCSLYIADGNFKNERLVVTRARPKRISDNAISPDGRSIAFAAGQSIDGSADFGIYKVDLDTNFESTVVEDKFFNVIGVDWLPGGNSLVATALRQNDDSIGIWNIDAVSKTATPLMQGHDSYKAVSIDDAGSKLVSTIRSADFRVFVHSMSDETKSISLGNGWTPRFAPNGKVLFASERSGRIAIWSTNADGTDQKHLSNGSDEFPVSSPDNSWVYFMSRRSGSIQVWKMKPDGSESIPLSKKEGGFPIGVSSDGYWIYYISAKGRLLRKVSSDGMQEEQLSDFAMYGAVISPDAQLVSYYINDSRVSSISLFSVVTNEPSGTIQLPRNDQTVKHLAWSSDRKNLFAILFDSAAKSSEVWKIAADGSSSTMIRDLKTAELGERSSFTVSPDERHFAIAMGRWKHDAILIHGLK